MVSSGGLSNEQLNLLWLVCENKHDDASRAIYDIIIDLSKIFSVESNEFIFSKINQIPQEKCDDTIIGLIKEFTINAVNNLNISSSNQGSCTILLIMNFTQLNIFFNKFYNFLMKFNKTKFSTKKKITKVSEYYGLPYLWDLAQDSSKINNSFIPNVITAFASIIKMPNFKSQRENYLTLCFENTKKGVSVSQNLLISLHILSSFNISTGVNFKETSC